MNTIHKNKETWKGEVPECCDLCKEEIVDVFIDGRIGMEKGLPWGFMCESCHLNTDVPLAYGYAQKYEKKDFSWILTEGLTKLN